MKSLLQKIWLAKLQWDESLSFDLAKSVLKWKSKLSELRDLKLNRFLVKTKQTDLNDAPETDFGVFIHVVAQDKQGGRKELLPTAKAKLELLKAQSNPHFELCAALLDSKLMKSVSKSLSQMNLKIKGECEWMDTTLVLSWRAAEANCWSTFVANRVAKI